MNKWTIKIKLSDRINALQTVKEVKKILGCNLKEAKDLVDCATCEPTTVKANICFSEAQCIRNILLQIPSITTTLEPSIITPEVLSQ